MTNLTGGRCGSSWPDAGPVAGARESKEARLERAWAALRKAEARQSMHSNSGRTLARETSGTKPYGVYHLPATIEEVLYALAHVMSSGGWAAVAGIADIGWEAANKMGVDPRRVAVIPDVKEEPHRVLGALVEGFEIVVLGNVSVAAPQQRALAARARKLSRTILTTTPWQTVSKPFVTSAPLRTGKTAGFEVIEGQVAM